MKKFIVMLLAVVLACGVFSVSSSAAAKDVTITVTPNVSTATASDEKVTVVYTIEVTAANDFEMTAFEFEIEAPEGVSLATNEGYTQGDKASYWLNYDGLLRDRYKPNNIFEQFNYSAINNKVYAASGSLSRFLKNETKTVMTISAEIEAGKEGNIALGIKNIVIVDSDKASSSEAVVNSVAITVTHECDFSVESTDAEYMKTAGTCKTEAVYYKSCSICGAAGTETFKGSKEGTKHTGTQESGVGAKASTCTVAGHTGKTIWNCCGTVIDDGEALPLAEHTYGDVTFTWKSDYTGADYTATCTKCQADYTGYVASEKDYTEATECGEYGSTKYTVTVNTTDGRGTVITGSDEKTVQDATPLAHDLADVAAKAATCTDPGYTAYQACKRAGCDYTVGKTVEPATGHKYKVTFTWAEDGTSATYKAVCENDSTHVEEGSATVKQTAGDDGDCKTLGSYTYEATATVDGKPYTDTKTVSGVYGQHDLKHVPAADATCMKSGNKECWLCVVCNKYFADAAGSTDAQEWEYFVVAQGSTNNHPGLMHVEAVEPTCTEGGNVEYWHCFYCDKYYSDSEAKNEITEDETKLPVDTDNHSFTKYESNKDATCTEDGTKTAECDRCSEPNTVTDEGSVLGHTYTKENVKFTWTEKDGDYVAEYVAVCSRDASHTTSGDAVVTKTTVEAKYCDELDEIIYTAVVELGGEEFTDKKVVDGEAGPHIYEDHYDSNENGHWSSCWICEEAAPDAEIEEHIYDQAGCFGVTDEDGNHYHYIGCDVCGYEKPDTREDCTFDTYWADGEGHWLACGSCGQSGSEIEKHTLGDWETIEEATATEDGYAYRKCTVCDYVIEDKILPATGTSSGNGSDNSGSGSETKAPPTGDEANIALWAVLFVMAGAGAAVLSLKKKEN